MAEIKANCGDPTSDRFSNGSLMFLLTNSKWWIICLLVVLVLGVATLYGLGVLTASSTIDVVPILFLLVSVWSIVSIRLHVGGVFNVVALFLLALVLFNGGQILLRAFGVVVESASTPVFDEDIYASTLLMVAIAVLAYVLGVLFAPRPSVRGQLCELQHNGIKDRRLLLLIGWAMVVLSAWPAANEMFEGIRTALASGYFSLYSGPVVTGIDAIGGKLVALLPAGLLFVLAGSDGHRSLGRMVSLFILILYTGGLLMQGYRGEAVMPLIAYGWLWNRTVRPLPVGLLITSAILLLFVVFPLIKETRNWHASERSTATSLLNAYASIENPIVAILNEMGASMNTVAYSIEIVPDRRAYDYGSGYAYTLLTVIPNPGSGVHPAASKVQYGKWLTQEVNPSLAARGGGLGFSVIAEAYVNFGWLGVPMVLFVIGHTLARLLMWTYKRPNRGRLLIIAVFMCFGMMYARGEFAYVLRPVIWYGVVPVVFLSVVGRSLRRKF